MNYGSLQVLKNMYWKICIVGIFQVYKIIIIIILKKGHIPALWKALA